MLTQLGEQAFGLWGVALVSITAFSSIFLWPVVLHQAAAQALQRVGGGMVAFLSNILSAIVLAPGSCSGAAEGGCGACGAAGIWLQRVGG